jgi:hypothetical protein
MSLVSKRHISNYGEIDYLTNVSYFEEVQAANKKNWGLLH